MLICNGLNECTEATLTQYQIIRRNSAVVPFEPAKIATAMMNSFLAVHGSETFIAGAGFLSGMLPNSLLCMTAAHRRWILATASSTKLQLMKASGFFSASKANLRNAH